MMALSTLGCLSILPSQAAAAEDEVNEKLQEVVVTAQKRAEDLQRVPVSIEVVSGTTLARQNLNNLSDLALTLPSVQVYDSGPSNVMFIRGIGSGPNTAFEQAVGTFIDDVYHGRSRTSDATFLDLEHIEVLKGPQSTYFGNNVIAGAFNILTQKPSAQFGASARLLYGMFGQYAAEGALNLPINDAWAVRLAGIANGQDGWLKNVNTGDHVPHENNGALRVTIAFRPNEDFDATLKIEGSDNKNEGAYPFQITDCPPPAPFVTAGFCALALAQKQPVGLDANENATSPGQVISLKSYESVFTLTARKWNQIFTSVTGYYGYDYLQNWDADSTPETLLNIQVPEHYHQFSQELRVASPTGGAFEYLAGAYFQSDSLHSTQDISFFFLSPIIEGLPPFSPLVPYLPMGQSIGYEQEEHSYSVFGSLTWNATDRLKLTAGLRGSWVDKSYNRNVFYGMATADYGGISSMPAPLQPLAAVLGGTAPGALAGDRSDHAWMPSAGIQYQADPSAMLYASYRRGFLAGGFNATDSSGVAANMPFAPEYVNAYEIGAKTKWWDDRVLLNLALFRSDYSDLQVSQQVANSAGVYAAHVENAGSALSQGVELQGDWAVTSAFRLAANVTYLEAYYQSYPHAAPSVLQTYCASSYILPQCGVYPFPVPPTQDLAGQPTPYAPRWSGNVLGSYRFPLGSFELTTEASAYFSSSFLQDSLNQWFGSYVRLDGRISLESPGGRWSVDLIGQNLTDRNIVFFQGPLPASPGARLQEKQAPRSAALQVRMKW